jgi:uncharacterized protein with HEPN domain
MEHSAQAYLFDIQRGCEDIEEFTEDADYASYSGNRMLKAAVERKFLVIRCQPRNFPQTTFSWRPKQAMLDYPRLHPL